MVWVMRMTEQGERAVNDGAGNDDPDSDLVERVRLLTPRWWDGPMVKTLRRLREWTQGQLATAMGIYQSQIARWENNHGRPGEVNRARLEALAEGLDVGAHVEDTKLMPKTQQPYARDMRLMQEDILEFVRAKATGGRRDGDDDGETE